MMITEDNKSVVRRFFEEFVGKGNWQILEEIIAPNAVDHTMRREDWTPTCEDFKQHIRWFRNAYPDMQITVDDLIAEGERVIAFWTMRGTHQGEFWGVQPTGRYIVGSAISLLRVQNGQIVEYAVRPDRLGVLLQLGSLGEYTQQLASAAP